MRISDWSSDVCSSDLTGGAETARLPRDPRRGGGTAAEGEGADRCVEGGDWLTAPCHPSESEDDNVGTIGGVADGSLGQIVPHILDAAEQRSAERMEGKECVIPGKNRGWTYH